MLDDYDPGFKLDQKPLGKEYLRIIVSCTDHPHDFARVVDEPFVICSHGKMEVQGLCAHGHIEKRIRVDDGFCEQPSLSH